MAQQNHIREIAKSLIELLKEGPKEQARERFYVVADGAYSQSMPRVFPSFTPWLDVVHPILEEIDPSCIPVGFSYAKPGYHYVAKDTDISLFQDSPRLFKPYAPLPRSFTPNEYVYLGLGMGATLLTLGLGEYFEKVRQTLPTCSLILVQPLLDMVWSDHESDRSVAMLEQLKPLSEIVFQKEHSMSSF